MERDRERGYALAMVSPVLSRIYFPATRHHRMGSDPSNENGTVQLVGYTTQKLYDSAKKELEVLGVKPSGVINISQRTARL